MGYYDDKDREEMPGDEAEEPTVPNNLDPDDPDADFFKTLPPNMGPGTPPVIGGMKVIPDGKGGFKSEPLTPDDVQMFRSMWSNMMGRRNTGAPTPNLNNRGPEMNHTIQYPHFYFMNREYIIQFVSGVDGDGPEVTLYIEVIKNPAVTQFDYSILDAYEKLTENQFLTFLISLSTDLYVWDVDAIKMNVVRNLIQGHYDEKIAIFVKAVRERPTWFSEPYLIDFVGSEVTDVVAPFADTPVQFLRNVHTTKHIWHPLVRLDCSFAIGSNSGIELNDLSTDMYSIYNMLVLPAVIDGVDLLYPRISMSSAYSRQTLASVHIVYETRITPNLLEVIVYIAPGYVVNAKNHIFGLMPLGGRQFATTITPIETLPVKGDGLGLCGSLIKIINHTQSSQDSQVFNLAMKPIGTLDIYNKTYSLTEGNELLFLFDRVPSRDCTDYWDDEEDSRLYSCRIYSSKHEYVRRYMMPDDEVLVPKDPEKLSPTDQFFKIYGFFEVDIIECGKLGMETFADIIDSIKEELMGTLKIPEKEFEGLRGDPKLLITEVWADGPYIRLIICRLDELRNLSTKVDEEYKREIQNRIKQINEGTGGTSFKPTPRSRGLFGFPLPPK